MKLVANMTLILPTESGVVDKTFTSTKEVGDAPTPQATQHLLHQFVGGLVNDIAAHQGKFRALAVTLED